MLSLCFCHLCYVILINLPFCVMLSFSFLKIQGKHNKENELKQFWCKNMTNWTKDNTYKFALMTLIMGMIFIAYLYFYS